MSSQLPVVEDEDVVGIIDEEDILLAVYDQVDAFQSPVRTAMTDNLTFIEPTTAPEVLLDTFRGGMVAIVKDDDKFLGLITRMDLLNHLRRRMR